MRKSTENYATFSSFQKCLTVRGGKKKKSFLESDGLWFVPGDLFDI